MATVKYFYVEDDTGVLFGANGTALTASLAAAVGLISEVRYPVPTFPLWFYFLGLVFAFLSKLVIDAYNNDIKERERSQSIRDFLLEMNQDPSLNGELAQQGKLLWAQMEDRRKFLLTESAVHYLNKLRIASFLASAVCFLIATSSIIIFVGGDKS